MFGQLISYQRSSSHKVSLLDLEQTMKDDFLLFSALYNQIMIIMCLWAEFKLFLCWLNQKFVFYSFEKLIKVFKKWTCERHFQPSTLFTTISEYFSSRHWLMRMKKVSLENWKFQKINSFYNLFNFSWTSFSRVS